MSLARWSLWTGLALQWLQVAQARPVQMGTSGLQLGATPKEGKTSPKKDLLLVELSILSILKALHVHGQNECTRNAQLAEVSFCIRIATFHPWSNFGRGNWMHLATPFLLAPFQAATRVILWGPSDQAPFLSSRFLLSIKNRSDKRVRTEQAGNGGRGIKPHPPSLLTTCSFPGWLPLW